MKTIFSDRALSQKLERAEARANADFVKSRARIMPESGAMWIDINGVYAMYDGCESPCTQTFGLGLFDEITGVEIQEIEKFFSDRGAPVFHEVSPMADASIMGLLNARGYKPVELTSVMYRPLEKIEKPAGVLNPGIVTRIISPDEADLWAKTSAAGWATEMEGMGEFMFQFSRISAGCDGASPFLAELDGKPVAAGMLFIYDDVAMFAGASTIPEGRNNGAQTALLSSRLKFAAEQGCSLAVMEALPGGQSQKNAQKNGFSIAYTRTKWQLNA